MSHLATKIQSDSREIRLEAIQEARHLGDLAAVDALLNLLKSPQHYFAGEQVSDLEVVLEALVELDGPDIARRLRTATRSRWYENVSLAARADLRRISLERQQYVAQAFMLLDNPGLAVMAGGAAFECTVRTNVEDRIFTLEMNKPYSTTTRNLEIVLAVGDDVTGGVVHRFSELIRPEAMRWDKSLADNIVSPQDAHNGQHAAYFAENILAFSPHMLKHLTLIERDSLMKELPGDVACLLALHCYSATLAQAPDARHSALQTTLTESKDSLVRAVFGLGLVQGGHVENLVALKSLLEAEEWVARFLAYEAFCVWGPVTEPLTAGETALQHNDLRIVGGVARLMAHFHPKTYAQPITYVAKIAYDALETERVRALLPTLITLASMGYLPAKALLERLVNSPDQYLARRAAEYLHELE